MITEEKMLEARIIKDFSSVITRPCDKTLLHERVIKLVHKTYNELKPSGASADHNTHETNKISHYKLENTF